jgi:hypothetical protein
MEDNLSKEDSEGLDSLLKKLGNEERPTPTSEIVIKDNSLKEKVAKFCLKLCNQTTDDLKDIAETSFNLVGFMQFTFEDDLDKIFEMAGELEVPHHASSDPIKLFNEMKNRLSKYLEKD